MNFFLGACGYNAASLALSPNYFLSPPYHIVDHKNNLSSTKMASSFDPPDFLTLSLSGKPEMSDFVRSKRARHRFTEHSSSDSSDSGTFLVSNVKFRVGAPPTQPLPVESGWSTVCTKVQGTFGTSLQDQAEIIAKAEGVEPLNVELLARFVPGLGSNSRRATILIVAEWNEASPSIWESIVKKTKKFVDSSTRGASLKDEVCVEMVARELTLPKYVTPIPTTELTKSFCEDWPRIAEKILDILDLYPSTKSRATSLALVKLGFSKIPSENPSTVYVSVDYESEESKWPPVVGEIQQLLNRYPHNLQVHMEHNTTIEFYPEFPLIDKPLSDREKESKQGLSFDPERKYNKLVMLGEDIGPECYLKLGDSGDEYNVPGLGTMGCWIEIKTKKEPQWAKYALTNWHVVRPAFDGFQLGKSDTGEKIILAPVRDSDLWKADLVGVEPGFASKKADIEHPARAKHCFAVQYLKDEIKANSTPSETAGYKKHLKEIKSFFDNNEQHFGSICWASGYTRRTENNGRLDWALIKPTGTGVSRIGENALPTKDDWKKRGFQAHRPRARGNLKQPPDHGLRSLANADLVFKVGTTTGATSGMFSHIKSKVKFEEDRHVQEYMKGQHRPYLSDEFLHVAYPGADKNWFSKKGDSGSVVFDMDGRAVALLFSGQMALDALNSWSFVTPIEDVFNDIKAFSKQEITDIRIAEDS
ncbi:hypothetical protein B0T25DRAFT_493098 [Lasiosphaeria hispida]|uniref:Uncharacterized protein n=1 Tax=Lasiosphaeria hispida TaxID=260671 RepID=A0AAJ0HWQ3_9PEZI|nr:hypothetical protein B0T25DRAFT_493098 [Lasiosphaeria hispida]